MLKKILTCTLLLSLPATGMIERTRKWKQGREPFFLTSMNRLGNPEAEARETEAMQRNDIDQCVGFHYIQCPGFVIAISQKKYHKYFGN